MSLIRSYAEGEVPPDPQEQAMAEVDRWFTFHPPKDEPNRGPQVARYEALRESGRQLARQVIAMVPPGPERNTAIEKLREAVMWANAGIACHE